MTEKFSHEDIRKICKEVKKRVDTKERLEKNKRTKTIEKIIKKGSK
jgi:hypothetical protein